MFFQHFKQKKTADFYKIKCGSLLCRLLCTALCLLIFYFLLVFILFFILFFLSMPIPAVYLMI